MATKVTFDGANLLVTINPGVTTINLVTEFYSAYKNAVISGVGDDLSKYPPLFLESIGGNDFGSGKNLGRFFIFNNADGWRIKPAEENSEVVIDGNLYPVVVGTPFTVATTGAYTSRLVFQRSVDAIEIQTTGGGGGYDLTYQHGVYWSDVGSAGQVVGTNGTFDNPCTSLADAIAVATAVGTKTIRVRGWPTPDANAVGYNFEPYEVGGAMPEAFWTDGLSLNGYDFSQSQFNNLAIWDMGGAGSATSVEAATFRNCIIQETDLPLVSCTLIECRFPGTYIDIAGCDLFGCRTTSSATVVVGLNPVYAGLIVLNTAPGVVGNSGNRIAGFEGDLYFGGWTGDVNNDRWILSNFNGRIWIDSTLLGDFKLFTVSGKGSVLGTPTPAMDFTSFITEAVLTAIQSDVTSVLADVAAVQADVTEIQGHVGRNKVVEVISRDARGNPTVQRTRLYDTGTNARANNPAVGLIKELVEIIGVFSTVTVDGNTRDVLDSFTSVDS